MLAANPELAATQLVQMANDNGGRDNVGRCGQGFAAFEKQVNR